MSMSRDSRIGLPLSSDSRTANSRARSCRMRAIRNRYLPRSAGRIGPPDAGERSAGGGDGTVDVRLAAAGDLGEDLLGGRVDRLEGLTGAVDELAVDEQAVRRRDVDDRARLGRGGVCEGAAHVGSVHRDVVGTGVVAGAELLLLEQEV